MRQLGNMLKFAGSILIFVCVAAHQSRERVDRELSGTALNVAEKGAFSTVEADTLDLYHFPGLQKAPHRLFSSVTLVVKLAEPPTTGGPGYEIYQSGNRSEVLETHASDRRFFGWFRRVALWKSAQLQPFRPTYVGVECNGAYAVSVRVLGLNYLYAGVFVGGLAGFFLAPRLTRNALFYYSAGTGVGLVASALILVFVLYKVLPKRSVALSVLVGGWSFSFYLLYHLWANLATVVVQYQRWLAAYLVTVFLVSFAVCYRVGPPKDPRSLNLLQWALQFLSLVLIFGGCQIPELGLAICLTLLLVYNVPAALVTRLERLWRRMRPPKVKLLTEAEFEAQGRAATAKALQELRAYCRSPDCDSWRTMSRLKSPQRMAGFVDGASHLSDAELLAFDVDASSGSSDDDDIQSDSDEGESRADVLEDAQFTAFTSQPKFASEGRAVPPRLRQPQHGNFNASLPSKKRPKSTTKVTDLRRRRSLRRPAEPTSSSEEPMPAYDEVSDDED